MNKSIWSRLILNQLRHLTGPVSRHDSAGPHFFISAGVKTTTSRFFSASAGASPSRAQSQQYIRDLLFELEREKQREKEDRRRLGQDTADIDAEEFEDFLGVGPLIEKLEKEKVDEAKLNLYEERSDSDSEDEDERFTPEAERKLMDVFQKKFKRHSELLENFVNSGI